MKANRDMTEQEFNYSYSLKRAIHGLNFVHEEIKSAKTVGMQGDSDAALRKAEGALFDLKAALYLALKTVGT